MAGWGAADTQGGEEACGFPGYCRKRVFNGYLDGCARLDFLYYSAFGKRAQYLHTVVFKLAS
jgi:hypothetical protein